MKVLFISYYFPPMGGAGVQRGLKFSKYLSEFDVHPIMITADEKDYVTDYSMLEEVPDHLEIYRIESIPFVSRLLRMYRRLNITNKFKNGGNVIKEEPGNQFVSSGYRDYILKLIFSLQFPDDKAGWAKKALKKAEKILQNENIDIILSSSPPISSHFLGKKLKQKYNIPLVVDFRDLWTGNIAYSQPSWRRKIDKWLEKRLLKHVDGVIGVTPTIVNELERLAPNNCEVNFLPNGYDEKDFETIEIDNCKDSKFRIIHAGTLYGHRTPKEILEAMTILLEKQPSLQETVRVRFIGNVGSRFEPMFEKFNSQYPNVVERFSYMTHSEVIKQICNADALLLIISGGLANRGMLTGKIFEYLRAARPILLLGPVDGDAAKLIQECKAGIAVDDRNINDVAVQMEKLILKKWSVSPINISKFERYEITENLANMLKRIKAEYDKKNTGSL